VRIPSLSQQLKLSNFISSIDQKIQTEKAILEQLEKQKKYLLQKMFV
jgi:type I restriction enzyme S subunit